MGTSQEHDRSPNMDLDERDNSVVLVGMVVAAISGAIIGFCFGGYFALALFMPVVFALGCLMGWKANTVSRPEAVRRA
ncbi:hypothetical protein FIV00_26110 [Labrenzia sp. THAF82]|uniref:hypothetical protein n=1 Tax=Labrenzia sp. THAF82 TaxID=2587861 RepID=UPI001267B018|nr:hypothetical protein [Labrenzia sp. THAF82]QFT33998.1 hypothetical protein FIV00_26110 [Labrenzia sp. THAF82]